MDKTKKIKWKQANLILVFTFFLIFIAMARTYTWASQADGLAGRLIVGYQGWFGCPGDYEGNTQWQHYFFNNIQDTNHLLIDLMPAVSEFSQIDLCKTDLRRPDGSPVFLYSSQNPRIVDKHFQWMANHRIDGAALQRFIGPVTKNVTVRRRIDNWILLSQAAAEKSGRVFFIAYDVAGAPDTVTSDIEKDWQYLANSLKITDSPNYLYVNRKPVLMIEGFGLRDRPGEPDKVYQLINKIKKGLDGLKAVYLIGETPSSWRTLDGDSKAHPLWADVYRSYDVINPWSVGRFIDDAGADQFLKERVLPDLAETRRLGIEYMPVIFPGFSWYNLMTNRSISEQAILNRIPRRCGTFLWRQVSNLLGAGANMLYAAMFDEVDEGTALLPVETRMDKLPVGANMVFLNQDGCALPDDWYLRVTGKAAEALRSRQTPPRDLKAVLKP
jgi:hypothetical protein